MAGGAPSRRSKAAELSRCSRIPLPTGLFHKRNKGQPRFMGSMHRVWKLDAGRIAAMQQIEAPGVDTGHSPVSGDAFGKLGRVEGPASA